MRPSAIFILWLCRTTTLHSIKVKYRKFVQLIIYFMNEILRRITSNIISFFLIMVVATYHHHHQSIAIHCWIKASPIALDLIDFRLLVYSSWQPSCANRQTLGLWAPYTTFVFTKYIGQA